MVSLLALSLPLVATIAAAPAGPPTLRGVQGVDDQDMSDYAMSLPDNFATLDARYAALDADLKPGNRRYNAFWSNVESGVPSSPTPIANCPDGYEAIPRNESDRIARGFLRFHCYNTATLLSFDALLTRDAKIGVASTMIVYGSPAWAQLPGCTGFPWPPNPNFTQGCIPWNNMDDWQDYISLITGRWNAPWGSGQARLSGLCIWNEIQSMGWSDPSPVLPNRWSGVPYTPSQLSQYTGAVASLMLRAGRAAARQSADGSGVMLWLSTDHFLKAPPLADGDVYHLGLYEFLDAFWPQMNVTYPWGVCVHPYDAGDPRANLTGQGIYTFATLRESVAAYQCAKLAAVAHVPAAQCWEWPQTQMWASEQGWPQSSSMTKHTQARNICYAHALSLAQGLWSVTHNMFQAVVSSSQGGSGDFSLIDEPPLCYANLTNCAGRETYEAYKATAPGVFDVTSSHYCCTQWATGCSKAGD